MDSFSTTGHTGTKVTRRQPPALLVTIILALVAVPVQSARGADSGVWSVTGSLANGRLLHTATTLQDGRVLVVGGNGSGVPNGPLASAEVYDPATGTWSGAGSLATARSFHTATILEDGRVLVAGGTGKKGGPVASAELYDPADGSWRETRSAPAEARSQAVAVLLSGPRCGQDCGKVLLAGGFAPQPSKSAELYDPKTDEWSGTADMTVGRAGPMAALLGGTNCGASCGKVLVAGGYFFQGHVDAAAGVSELYDPDTKSWAPTGALKFPRTSTDAVVLPDSKVLVAGGNGAGGGSATARTLSQVYDPASGVWSQTEPLHHPRVNGSWLARLADGTVLAAGGASATPAELFDPVTRSWAVVGAPLEGGLLASSAVLNCGAGGGRVLLAGGAAGAEKASAVSQLFTPVPPVEVPACTKPVPKRPAVNSTSARDGLGAPEKGEAAAPTEGTDSRGVPVPLVAAVTATGLTLICLVVSRRRRRRG